MPPIAQLLTLFAGYAAHVAWLSRAAVVLLLPFGKRRVEIGAENVVGVGIIVAAAVRAMWLLGDDDGNKQEEEQEPPPPRAAPSQRVPWGEPRSGTKREIVETAGTLVCAFSIAGYGHSAFGYLFHCLAAAGLPITAGQRRALQVLCGHGVWVVMAARVLGKRLEPFFPSPIGRGGKWLSLRWRTDWLLWALGGYFASVLTYNAAEGLNEALLPLPPNALASEADPGMGRAADDTLIEQLINPEDGDLLALGIGAVAPCLSAPIFEEVLYRGFLLPALRSFMPMALALPLHALLFGLHHQSLAALLPLSALGLLWGWMYLRSGNLLAIMLIHALWNTRIFIGSLVQIVS